MQSTLIDGWLPGESADDSSSISPSRYERHPTNVIGPAAQVTSSLPHGGTAALNQALSEIIDELQELKQARWRVAHGHPLHAALDDLFEDLKAWARLLVEQDEALGVSPLAAIPSVAGRTPTNTWPGTATDDEVWRTVRKHLDRLAEHVAAALAEQDEGPARASLAAVQRGLEAHTRRIEP
jgi:DNA-binding ferritin-like protein